MQSWNDYQHQAEASRMTGGLIPHPSAQPLRGGPFNSAVEVGLFGSAGQVSSVQPEYVGVARAPGGSASDTPPSGFSLIMLLLVGATIFAPPLLVPGYALYRFASALAAFHFHPIFVGAVEAGVVCAIAAIGFKLWARYFSRLVSSVRFAVAHSLAGLYFATSYAALCLFLWHNGGVAIFAALVGAAVYFRMTEGFF